MHGLSFWMLLSFVLYFELVLSFLGKVSEISFFCQNFSTTKESHFHLLNYSPNCSDDMLLRKVQLENLSCVDLLLFLVSSCPYQVFPLPSMSEGCEQLFPSSLSPNTLGAG